MFKLCFNSTTLRNIDVFQALNLIKQYGYEGVELTLNDTHFHPLKHNRSKLKEIKVYSQDNEIDIVCVAAGGPDLLGDEPYEPSLIHMESSKRKERIDFIKQCIDVANDLNSPILNINSGILKEGGRPEKAYEFLYNSIHELLAQVGDLILVIEPEPNFFIGTTNQAIELIEKIDSPNLKLNLDIGHVFCSEENCYEHIKNALPYSRHIHIEDIKNGVHYHEIPGDGDIDFKEIIDLIKNAGYAHYVSVELHHHDAVWQKALKESREYLLKLI